MTDSRRDAKLQKDLDEFFDRELMPLARSLKSRGTELLDTARANGAATYYVRRELRAMGPEAFEWGSAESPEELAAALRRLWQDPASQPLCALAPSLGRLARQLYTVEDQPGEVSSFVYVMY